MTKTCDEIVAYRADPYSYPKADLIRGLEKRVARARETLADAELSLATIHAEIG